MYKGVIFDFNGTLFEDEDLQAEGWAAVIRKYFHREMTKEEFYGHILGLGNLDILRYLNSFDPEKQFDISITDEKEIAYRAFCRDHPERTVLLPGAEETFEALQAAGIPFAIATASEITNVDFYFETFRLDRWFPRDRVIYDDRTFPVKPAPDIYLHAAARLGLDPADCVVCEDTASGVRSAAAAGAGRIIARRSDPTGGTEPKIYAVIDDFRGFFPKYLED